MDTMKNTGRLASSLCCCLLFFLITATGQERKINYYLYWKKEKPEKYVSMALKYVMGNDGQIRVEEYEHYMQEDTISLTKSYLFRVRDQSLIRYTFEDTIEQTYLKFQLDTSFLFYYKNSPENDSVISRYLGKEVLFKDASKREFHKFSIYEANAISYVYLHDDFLLERREWNHYYHGIIERVDSSQVPKRFREQVEKYKSKREIEQEEIAKKKALDNETGKVNRTHVVSAVVLLLFFTGILYWIRNKRAHPKNNKL